MNTCRSQTYLDTSQAFTTVNTGSDFALSDMDVVVVQFRTHTDMHLLVSDTSCPYLDNHHDHHVETADFHSSQAAYVKWDFS